MNTKFKTLRRRYTLPRAPFALFAFVFTSGSSGWAQTHYFEDVTDEMGVSYLQWSTDTNDDLYCFQLPRMLGGVAAGDFDNDGFVDLYVTCFDGPNHLFHNQKGKGFNDIAATVGVDLVEQSSGCAWGDVNNDGLLDLYVLTQGQRNYLFLNQANGQFRECAADRGVDIPIVGTRHWMMSAAFGDFDQDGWLDLHVTDYSDQGAQNKLLRNTGNGFFTNVTDAALVTADTSWGFASSFSDFNSDGWLDLAIVGDFGTSHLFQNLTNGTFEEITSLAGVGTDENGMGSAIGDIDGDGDLDWFVTSIYDEFETCETEVCIWGYSGNRLYLNDGHGRFTDQTDWAGVRDGGWGWGTSFLDFDNDGDLDLTMTNGVDFPCYPIEDQFNDDAVRLWENDGSGRMTDVASIMQIEELRAGKGLVVLDFDSDGDLDIFIANNADSPALLENKGGSANGWLRVNLRGTISNSFGIGARLELRVNAGDDLQLREVSANSNYLSQNETTAHFGLGSNAQLVNELIVTWPASGLVQAFTNLAPNRTVTINELIYGDLTRDGLVRVNDLQALGNCLAGPGMTNANPLCLPGDVDLDADLDLQDWSRILHRLP